MTEPAPGWYKRAVFYEADRKTYGGAWEFVVGSDAGPDAAEYRWQIENREYQVTLVRLVDLATRASRYGHAVWLQLELNLRMIQRYLVAERDELHCPFGGLDAGYPGDGEHVALLHQPLPEKREGFSS